MNSPALLAGAVFCAVLAGPAVASPCTAQIDALAPRLDASAEAAGALSSSGQGVAAAREAQAMVARDRDQPVGAPAVPFQEEGQEAQATRKAAQAGGGGDRVMQAKAVLNRARALDEQGNGEGCLEAVAEAKRMLDAAP